MWILHRPARPNPSPVPQAVERLRGLAEDLQRASTALLEAHARAERERKPLEGR